MTTTKKKARFRATRTTPDPYPPAPVFVFTDKSEAEVRKANCISVKYIGTGESECAHGGELSDFIDLSMPQFRATVSATGEPCLIFTHHTLGELLAEDPTTCVEIGHPEEPDAAKELVAWGQLVNPEELDLPEREIEVEATRLEPGEVPVEVSDAVYLADDELREAHAALVARNMRRHTNDPLASGRAESRLHDAIERRRRAKVPA